jgi:hypothetical protein
VKESNRSRKMRILVTTLGILRPVAQKLGPYLLLELLLPGGTLLALSLFLYRRWREGLADSVA